MQPDNQALSFKQSTFYPCLNLASKVCPSGSIPESKLHFRAHPTLFGFTPAKGKHVQKNEKKSWERLRDFKYLAPKKDLSEQFFVICGQTSWSSALKNLHYLDHTSAYVYAKGHYCNFKTVGVDAWQKPKMPAILYIYRSSLS